MLIQLHFIHDIKERFSKVIIFFTKKSINQLFIGNQSSPKENI